MSHELVIGDERFACQDELAPWALMKLAKAGRSDDDQAAVAGMYDLLMAAVLPEEHARFEAYMESHFVSFTKLGEVLNELMAGYSNRPTERPSLSLDGQAPMPATSRVVSLSRGTVREVKTSTKDGAQAVS